MIDWVGQQLGNYRVIRLLGRGGFADVYLGEHIYLETQAAIKVLHTQLATDDIEQFRIEARTIARLIHPHIVRVLEFGVQGTAPFLVMDYAPNGTLRQRHPKGIPLPVTTVVSYVKQIAPALQYAHDQKLIHRDIKPENLLVGRANEILLSDFGIALVAQSSRYQGTQDMAGTIAYMAPEQIQAHPRPASDQYSLGIVIYEWLSGDRPFHGSFTEIAIKHSVVTPPPLRERIPTLSTALEQVVMTALEKDPKQRFATVQAFANAFEQASQIPATEFKTPTQPSQPVDATILAGQPQQSIAPITPPEKPIAPTVFAPPPPQTLPPTQAASPAGSIILPTVLASSSNPSTTSQGLAASLPVTSGSSSVAQSSASTTARLNLIPLGLVAFAFTIFFFGLLSANVVQFSDTTWIFLGLGGLIQLIAGIQALRKGNAFFATMLCSYGAFGLVWSTFFAPAIGIINPYFRGPLYLIIEFDSYAGTHVPPLGYFFLSWAIFTGLMSLSIVGRNRVLLAVFSVLFLSFLGLTIGAWGFGNNLWLLIGGWLCILTAVITIPVIWLSAIRRSNPPLLPSATVIDPTALGLSAFALTLFFFSAINAFQGDLFLFHAAGPYILVGLAIFYGGLVQIIAGVQTFRIGQRFLAIAFCVHGAFWLVIGVIRIPNLRILDSFYTLYGFLGILLLIWAVFTGIMFFVTLKRNRALTIGWGILCLTFLSLGIASTSIAHYGPFIFYLTFSHIVGWLGLLSALVLWYIALASIFKETGSRFSLPIGVRH